MPLLSIFLSYLFFCYVFLFFNLRIFINFLNFFIYLIFINIEISYIYSNNFNDTSISNDIDNIITIDIKKITRII